VKVGIPKEIKNHEYRVAITPAGVMELVQHGHQVVIETGAGLGSSIPDADYVEAGSRCPGTEGRGSAGVARPCRSLFCVCTPRAGAGLESGSHGHS
jgi:hypothetical protein